MQRIALAAVTTCLLGGCSPKEVDRDSTRIRDVLQLLDSVRLAENDSFFIGKPTDRFAVGPDGSYYIADQLSDRLLQFDRTGAMVRAFGRRGRGPGEITRAGVMTVIIDSLLIHATMGRFIHVFRASDGSWLGTRSVRGFLTDAMNYGDRILIGNFDFQSRFGVTIVDKSDLLRNDAFAVGSSLARFPEEYSTYPDLDIANMVYAVGWRDTLAVAFAGVDQIVFYSAQGGALDTLRLPVRLRRGTSKKAYQLFRFEAGTMNERVRAMSFIVGIFLLPDGRLAITHMDVDAHQRSKSNAFQLLSHVWVSIIDRREQLACVDVPIPAFASETARLAIAGDTLYTLDQILPENADSAVRSVIRRYMISPSDCPWMPLE